MLLSHILPSWFILSCLALLGHVLQANWRLKFVEEVHAYKIIISYPCFLLKLDNIRVLWWRC